MISFTLIIASLIIIYLILEKKKQPFKKLSSILPGPNPWPVIGNILMFAHPQKDLLRKFNEIEKQYPSPTRYWLGPDLYVSIKKPEHFEAILSSTSTVKGDVYKIIQDCIGYGLIQSEGLKHRIHRKVMSAPLKGQVLENFIEIFDAKGKECATNIGKYLDQDYFDVLEDVEKSTMALVCETILGIKMNSQDNDNEDLIKIISGLYRSISERMYKVWLHPYLTFRMSKHYKLQKEGIAKFCEFLEQAVNEKKKSNNKTNAEDSLQRLLEAKDDNGKNIFNHNDVMEELITLFTASEDTSTTVTGFTILMLAMHQDVQNAVWEEQIRVFGSNGDPNIPIESYHLKNMTYLHMVIEEVLRLFPVAPLILRKMNNDLQMGELKLVKNTNVMMNIYAAHRDENVWPEPDKFDPLRFTPEEKAKRHQYTYVPFSAGNRSCIGKPFAFMAIKSIVSHIIRRYRLYNEWDMKDVVLEADISVRSTNGYKIKIKKRLS